MKLMVTLTCIASALLFIRAQELVSPCPNVFVYEPRGTETDRWYGVIQLSTDVDLNYIIIDVELDRSAHLLGNWFGEVTSSDNIHFTITNRKKKLHPGAETSVRIFVKYPELATVPLVRSIELNGRNICPQEGDTERTTTASTLTTRNYNVRQTTRRTVPTSTRRVSQVNPNAFNGGSQSLNSVSTNNPNKDDSGSEEPHKWLNVGAPKKPQAESDEGFFEGDFRQPKPNQNRPASRPSAEESCGVVAAQPAPLITNGHSTQEGQWPWHAAIYRSNGIDLSYICGASLISKRHVVTAGHCVTKVQSNRVVSNEALTVYLGKYNLRLATSQSIQIIPVSKIFVHSGYNHSSFLNDLAVLKLTRDVEITNWVRPVCLWRDNIGIDNVLNREGTVVGWGYDESGRITEELTQAKMPVVDSEVCLRSSPEFYGKFFFSETSYCAGFRNGTSVCNGDSGGGMVFPSRNSNPAVWHLRGLVSISVALQNENVCDPSQYVVFTDLAKYRTWLEAVLDE